jgi:hypothetical protein
VLGLGLIIVLVLVAIIIVMMIATTAMTLPMATAMPAVIAPGIARRIMTAQMPAPRATNQPTRTTSRG